jgi:hypothetical protein
MFRLLKLVAYGLLGYALYEFFRGMSEGGGAGGGREEGAMGRNFRDESARANMTGPGEGQDMTTQDDSGESVRHRVGRGVVSAR